MSNYDATNGLPFTRISDISITYPPVGAASVTYHTRHCLVDKAGVLHVLSNTLQQVNMTIDPSDKTPLQVYNPSNGQAIAGATTSAINVLLNIYAAIHANQLASDAATTDPTPATPTGS